MDKHLRRRIEEALRGFASSGRSDFAGHEDAHLNEYLDITKSLRADARALDGPVSSDRGRAQMLSALNSQYEVSGGVRRMIFSQPLVIKVAGAAAGVALVFVGMAGASAAAGGPNVADDVFNAAGVGDSDDHANVNDNVNDDVNDDDAGEDVNDDADQADNEADDQTEVEDASEVDNEADDQADVEDSSEVDDESNDVTDHAADDSHDGASDGAGDAGEVESD